MANLSVFLVMLALLKTIGGGTDNITPKDKTIFWVGSPTLELYRLCRTPVPEGVATGVLMLTHG